MPNNKPSNANGNETERESEQSQYEDWPKDDLMQKAEEAGIEGYADMNKKELVAAIRDQ